VRLVGPQDALITNDEVAAIARRYPDRFAGVAAVDLARPMDALRELRRCVRDLGFRALRVVPWLWNIPPDDRRYYPLYAGCVELGIWPQPWTLTCACTLGHDLGSDTMTMRL
jgi:uncharacterized protein